MATYGEFLVPFWQARKHPRISTQFHVANFTDEPIYWRFVVTTESGELEDHVTLAPAGAEKALPRVDGVSCHLILPPNRSSSLKISAVNHRGHARAIYLCRADIDRNLVGLSITCERIHIVTHAETHEPREESCSSKALFFQHRPIEGTPPFSFPDL